MGTKGPESTELKPGVNSRVSQTIMWAYNVSGVILDPGRGTKTRTVGLEQLTKAGHGRGLEVSLWSEGGSWRSRVSSGNMPRQNRSGESQVGTDRGVDNHCRSKPPGAPASLERVIRAASTAMPTLRAPAGKPNLFFFSKL